MGSFCSIVKDGDDPSLENEEILEEKPRRRLLKMPQALRPVTRSKQSWQAAISKREFNGLAEYDKALRELQDAEKAIAFDAQVFATASDVERRAVAIVGKLRLYDLKNTYGEPLDSKGQHTGRRTQGEHYLGNVDLINKTQLMKVARRLPKGAHLHIHFNSCLPAKFLIQQARNIDAMYIRSTLPLTTPQSMIDTRISFMVMTPHEATHKKGEAGTEEYCPLGNVWDSSYIPNTWMPYKEFQRQFEFVDEKGQNLSKTVGAETWLERKMQISEEEAHGCLQTGHG